jgi:hypothetical protein
LPENALTAKEPSPRAVAGKDMAANNEDGTKLRFIDSDKVLLFSEDMVMRIGVWSAVGEEYGRLKS